VQVVVENRGNQSETFSVTLRDPSGTVVGQIDNSTLTAGDPVTSITVPFTWSTAGLSAGSYILTATVSQSPGVVASASSAPVALAAPATGLTVSSLSPNQFRRSVTYSVQITGTGFVSGTKLKFVNGTGPAPLLSNVKVVSGTTITATVTVSSDAKNSVWDLLLTNPDGTTATLSRAATVTR
jgi:hypothetical protein